jgi:hypothetical protein
MRTPFRRAPARADVLVQQLHDAAARVGAELLAVAASGKPEALAGAAAEAAHRLARSRCALPLLQAKMIEEFRSLVGAAGGGRAGTLRAQLVAGCLV